MDQNKKHSSEKTGLIIALIVYIAVGFICGIFVSKFVGKIAGFEAGVAQTLLVWALATAEFYFAFVLQLIIHEAGHMLAGLMSGYKFGSFRIANMMWVKTEGKLRFCRLSIVGTGGQCLMIPPEIQDGKFPFVLYNLGGSLMNLVSVPVFVLLCFLAAPLPALSLFFIMCAVTGITGAAMNGIPLRMGPINNDGHDIVEMSENSAALRSFWIQLKVVGKTAEGIRLKDMPEKWFDMPEQSELDNSITATCAVFRENRLADLHNFDEAKQLSDELLELKTGIIGLHRNLLICDRIYLELLSDKDNELIEKLYSKELKIFMKQMRKFPTIIRTEYAYALLYENDSAKADQIKQRFIVCRKTYPYAADIESELELMGLAESAANRVE